MSLLDVQRSGVCHVAPLQSYSSRGQTYQTLNLEEPFVFFMLSTAAVREGDGGVFSWFKLQQLDATES